MKTVLSILIGKKNRDLTHRFQSCWVENAKKKFVAVFQPLKHYPLCFFEKHEAEIACQFSSFHVLDVLRELSLHSHTWPHFMLSSPLHRWGNGGSERSLLSHVVGRVGAGIAPFWAGPWTSSPLLPLLSEILGRLFHASLPWLLSEPVLPHTPSSFPGSRWAFRIQPGSPDLTLSLGVAQSGDVLFMTLPTLWC